MFRQQETEELEQYGRCNCLRNKGTLKEKWNTPFFINNQKFKQLPQKFLIKQTIAKQFGEAN